MIWHWQNDSGEMLVLLIDASGASLHNKGLVIPRRNKLCIVALVSLKKPTYC